ncbi:MAG: hydroxysqualene dehydroxylase HpnE [Terriglobia bacterium]|jgi:zeta-carotene desaturase
MPDEVLIIGGGFSGLAAGVALAEEGRGVRLLEQKPHLGGRARSFLDPATGSVVDNGQHIIMGCYHSTIHFLSTIGTLDRIRFQKHLTVRFLDRNGRLTALQCPGLPSPWHVLLGVLRCGSFSFKHKLEVLRLGRSLQWARAMDRGWEKLSVREWLTRLGQSESLQRNFWDLLCIAALNEDPSKANAGLFERVLRLALFSSPADSRIGIARVGLSDVYVDAATAYLRARGGRVECSRSVASLLVSEGQCRGVRLSSGKEIEAESVLSAVPSFQLAGLLPGELLRFEPFFAPVISLGPAPIISINLWFDRPITELDFVGLRGTTIQWLFNKGTNLGSGENYVSLVLSGAHRHIGRGKEELLATALRELGDLFPEAQKARLHHALVIKERFATFSPTWEAEQVRPTARTPVRGLYLAGDWTATGLPGTIESAVQSGYTAAEAILDDGRIH